MYVCMYVYIYIYICIYIYIYIRNIDICQRGYHGIAQEGSAPPGNPGMAASVGRHITLSL